MPALVESDERRHRGALAEVSRPLPADIVSPEHIQDASAVGKAMHDVLAQERAVQMELEQRLRNRADMEAELLTLMATLADALHQGNAEADGLATSIRSSAAQAQKVSQRVRKLDTAQANLTATLGHIRLVVSCGSCVAGVRAALDAGDYDALAEHIAGYQELMASAGGAGGDGALERQLERGGDAGAIVARARERLLEVTRQHVKEALAAQDAPAALRWLRLYKPLQLPDEGMAAALQFVKSTQKKADAAQAALEKAVAQDAAACDFLAALSGVLKDVFRAVKEYRVLVTDAFGAAHVETLVVAVTEDLDNKVPRIVSLFVKARGLEALVRGIAAADPSAAALEPVAVDRLLGELRGLLACCQGFSAFLCKTAAEAVHPRPLPRAVADALRGGGYAHAMHELQAAYVSLERVYLERSVAKAVELDAPVAGAMMSSVLDDTFFVLKQTCMRALSTGSMHCFVSTVSLVVAQLAGPFSDALARKLPGCPHAVVELVAGGASPPAAALEEAAAPLNNLVLSTVYVTKMHSALETKAVQSFTAAADAEAVRSALDDLQQAGLALRERSMQFGEAFADHVVQHLLRQPLAALAAMSFDLSDAQYSAAESEPGWARPLCASLQHYLDVIAQGLAGETQQELARSLVARLVFRIESHVSAKQFSALGGLLLDRDVRALTSGLADITGQPVRERCARLTQMVMLLTLESLEEVGELWADGSVTWRLSAAEARAVLASRTDLERSAVAELQLE